MWEVQGGRGFAWEVIGGAPILFAGRSIVSGKSSVRVTFCAETAGGRGAARRTQGLLCDESGGLPEARVLLDAGAFNDIVGLGRGGPGLSVVRTIDPSPARLSR